MKFKDLLNENENSDSILDTNIYRIGSEKYFEFFEQERKKYNLNSNNYNGFDEELLKGDIGKIVEQNGEVFPLDCPMVNPDIIEEEKDVELNKPKRGGSKKFYVYVKNDKGNIVKVQFGDTSGLKAKINDKAARASFVARHKCDTKTDKTKASYWSCRLPYYAKQLGLSGGGKFFW